MDETTPNHIHGVLTTVWGNIAEITIEPGKTLEATQTLAADGGCVTLLVDDDGRDWWLDDEGLLKPGAQINYVAKAELGYDSPLVGNAVVLRSDPETGESLGLSAAEIALWRDRYDVEPGTFTVAEAAAMEGDWWPGPEQRREIAETQPPIEAPAPQVWVMDGLGYVQVL